MVNLKRFLSKISLIFSAILLERRKLMHIFIKIASTLKCMGPYEYLLNPSPFSGRIFLLPPSSPQPFFPFNLKKSSSNKIHEYLSNPRTDCDKFLTWCSEFDLDSDFVAWDIKLNKLFWTKKLCFDFLISQVQEYSAKVWCQLQNLLHWNSWQT